MKAEFTIYELRHYLERKFEKTFKYHACNYVLWLTKTKTTIKSYTISEIEGSLALEYYYSKMKEGKECTNYGFLLGVKNLRDVNAFFNKVEKIEAFLALV